MSQLFANNAYSALGSSILIGATSLTLASGTGSRFPTPSGGDYFLLTLADTSGGSESAWEIVKVTARSVDTLTIERAQEGTTARAWASGVPVDLRVTAGSIVSGANIKTVGGISLIGSGDIPVGGGDIADYQEFTSSGTWNKPTGVSFVYFECVNGGGSGGTAFTTSSSGTDDASGASGGLWMSSFVRAADLSSTVSVIVGAGGAGVTRSTNGLDNGLVGGASSFNGIGALTGSVGFSFGNIVTRSTVNGGAGSEIIQNFIVGTFASGVSQMHGDAGAGVGTSAANAAGVAGAFPGGAGGPACVKNGTGFSATSGAGAAGVVRVWAW